MPAMQALGTAINRPQDGRRWCCFPCNLSRCLPCLPTSWTKVQDWLHLILIFGVVGSLLCLIQMIYELGFGERCRSPLCFKQWVAGVIVLPTTVYFIQTIGKYDEQLREKKQRHEHEVERLITSINQQVEEMNDLCRKVTENANNFATGRFNDKSDAFKLFLRQVKDAYASLYVEPEMLEQLRRFVIAWFQAFAGTLINPRDNALLSGAERELSKCATVQAICDAAMKRLEGNSVAFRFQMPNSSPVLRHRTIEDGSSASFASAPAEARALCGVSWVSCGRFPCCRRRRSPSVNGMPVTFLLGCMKLKILSRSHLNLLLAFLADILLVFFEMYNDRWSNFILVIINEACIVSMLACFEQINEIAQLEQQIQVFEQRSEEVGQRRDEAKESWEKVQQLHDLWLFRTLPSLTIMGKVHTHLGLMDMDRTTKAGGRAEGGDPRLEFLRKANEGLSSLQRKLGTLEDWRTAKEPLAAEWKDSIGKQLRDLEGERLEDVLGKLEEARSIEAPLPPPGAALQASSSGALRP